MNPLAVQYASLTELLAVETRAEDWLSPGERLAAQTMRASTRRETWLAGRILAKRMLRHAFGSGENADWHPAAIEIDTRSERPAHSDRPRARWHGNPLPCHLSIAHTARGVLVAVSRDLAIRPGVDLVADGADTTRLSWAFTPAERDWLAGKAPPHAAQLWAMKEALYKAGQQGEGFSPARIEVIPGRTAHYPNSTNAIRHLQHWRVDEHWAALALVAVPRPDSNANTLRSIARAA